MKSQLDAKHRALFLGGKDPTIAPDPSLSLIPPHGHIATPSRTLSVLQVAAPGLQTGMVGCSTSVQQLTVTKTSEHKQDGTGTVGSFVYTSTRTPLIISALRNHRPSTWSHAHWADQITSLQLGRTTTGSESDVLGAQAVSASTPSTQRTPEGTEGGCLPGSVDWPLM